MMPRFRNASANSGCNFIACLYESIASSDVTQLLICGAKIKMNTEIVIWRALDYLSDNSQSDIFGSFSSFRIEIMTF
jgi:hypothetical protein